MATWRHGWLFLPRGGVFGRSCADRVPPTGVAGAWARRFRAGPGWSDDHCRQSDDGIIAQGGHGFQRHVAGALDRPFVILLQKDRADEPDDSLVIWKDADDLGAPFDLAVEPFEAIGRVQLRPMLGGKLI